MEPTEDEMEWGRMVVDIFGKCDLVLSHTCPSIFEPTDLYLDMVDQSMVDKTMERYLGEIELKLEYRAWAFGHYHRLRDYPLQGGRRMLMVYNDKFVRLDKVMDLNNRIKEVKRC